jgi:hypothetical protein
MERFQKLLVVIVVLQAMALLGIWSGGAAAPLSQAHAQVPDASTQRAQMVDELRTLNRKMDRLMKLLEDGNLQVRAVAPDEERGNAANRRPQ